MNGTYSFSVVEIILVLLLEILALDRGKHLTLYILMSLYVLPLHVLGKLCEWHSVQESTGTIIGIGQ